ncbi:hypothetical protein C0L75_03040 [Clostridium perfringens]
MAFSSYRTKFQGTLANVPVAALRELDFTRTNIAERLEYINLKYKKVKDFYNTYIFTKEKNEESFVKLSKEDYQEYYKVNLNTTDELSSEINIFKYCEADANYLLNSLDVIKDKQQQYTILSEEEFKKILAKERSITSLTEDEENQGENKMEILAAKETNDYINMNHSITKKDLEDEKCGKVLREYNNFRDFLREEMYKCKDSNQNSNIPLYLIKRNLQSINDDMLLAKIQLKGIRNPAKRLGDIGSLPNIYAIDYSNPKHIKQILKFIKLGDLHPDNELSHIAFDMKVAIKNLKKQEKLNDTDLEVLEGYNAGEKIIIMAKELNISEGAIRQRLRKIFNYIANFYDKDYRNVDKMHICEKK